MLPALYNCVCKCVFCAYVCVCVYDVTQLRQSSKISVVAWDSVNISIYKGWKEVIITENMFYGSKPTKNNVLLLIKNNYIL